MVGAPRDKYRVGAIGCGPKGTSQARTFALHPLTEVVSAADTDPDNLEIFCGRFDVPGYGSHLEMLDREAIDIAMPVLSVRPNARVVIDCARAGVKAILCEKPICASLEDADRMVEECRSRGIPFAAGDMVRNLPLVWKTKELLDSGELGEVQGMNLYYPKASSTEMWGGGCQALSVMRLFAGDVDVEWVVGWVKGDPWSDDDQGMAGHVRFANGIECTIHSKEAVKKGIEVLCTRGAFFRRPKLNDARFRSGNCPMARTSGLRWPGTWTTSATRSTSARPRGQLTTPMAGPSLRRVPLRRRSRSSTRLSMVRSPGRPVTTCARRYAAQLANYTKS